MDIIANRAVDVEATVRGGDYREIGPKPIFVPPPPVLPPGEKPRGRYKNAYKSYKFWNPVTSTPIASRDPGSSNRIFHIRRLCDLVHILILRGNIERSRRAWSIVCRCHETEGWLSDGIVRELATNPQTKRELIERIYSRTLKLREIIIDMIVDGRVGEALDELELYLPSSPYCDDPVLQFYAGQCALYLSQSSPTSNSAPKTGKFQLVPLDPILANRSRTYLRRAIEVETDRINNHATDAVGSQILGQRMSDVAGFYLALGRDNSNNFLVSFTDAKR